MGRRTFFRDLQTLKEAGIPYRYDRVTGYHIDQDSYLPPVNLTVPETLGLMMLAKAVAGHRDRPMIGSALSAIYKLVATVPDPIRQACSDLMSNISIAPDARPTSNHETRYYTLLQRCIDEGRTCRIVYRSPVEEDDLHAMLNPYLLHYANRAWYVFGYTDVHDDVRVLKLTRIIELEPTEERFVRPENFRVEDKIGNAWSLIPEGKEYRVVLEFSRKVATNVSEVCWHKSQTQEILPDGRCRMTFTVDGINEIAWWVCGYADQVTVVKPPELRDRVAQMHRSALRLYESAPTDVVTRPVQPTPAKKTPKP